MSLLAAGLALLWTGLLLAQLSPAPVRADAGDNPRRLTTAARVAAWSPDGRTLLVNRWGAVVGRQALSELWAVDVRSGDARRLSANALDPRYLTDGGLTYLSFAGDGRWEARALDVESGRETPLAAAAAPRSPTERFSPDGRRRAYVTFADGVAALWMAPTTADAPPLLLARGEMELFSSPTWSPDSRRLAFSRTPLGAETAAAGDIWLVDADGAHLHPLLQNEAEESNPLWSPDGRYLAFERDGEVWLFDLSETANQQVGRSAKERGGKGTNLPGAQLTPPAIIRVIHDASNTCRNVPVGQIDVIDFENYVERVVPSEVWASWPEETLKAQAVAARTYAWHNILHPTDPNWDVTDSTRHQVMCDRTYPTTSAAVQATRGQYIAYQGEVIKAFFSAENSSPTRSAAGYPYIQAIDDPMGFRRARNGHGWGMSQWGAYRWAAWRGWSYVQILTHYYTGVTVELPANGGPTPLIGIARPWASYFATGNRIYLKANASDEAGAVQAVEFRVGETRLAAAPGEGWDAVWDVSALSDTAAAQAITLTAVVTDADGHAQAQAIHIGLDRRPPTPTLVALVSAYPRIPTVTFAVLSATDATPGSGVEGAAFSQEGWAWEAEELYHTQGEVITDAGALNGLAWRGDAYGPYTYALPPGHAYRAYFRLKPAAPTLTTTEVALLDVVDNGGARLLGLRRLRGTDFRAAQEYQEFPVDFDYPTGGTSGVEFRLAPRAELLFDRVLVVSYPVALQPGLSWTFPPGEGRHVLTVKFVDGAGNVSADVTRTVTVDVTPPGGWRDFAPEEWDGGPPPTLTVRVSDTLAGLDVGSARYRFSTDGGESWSEWLTATCSGVSGTTGWETVAAPALPFGLPRAPFNRVEFRIADMAGNESFAAYGIGGPVTIAGPGGGVVGAPYTFTAAVRLPITPPITYTWQAAGGGVVVHSGGLSDTAVFSWDIAGVKGIVVTTAHAGGAIGVAGRTVTIGGPVYLPLTLRNWPLGSLRWP